MYDGLADISIDIKEKKTYDLRLVTYVSLQDIPMRIANDSKWLSVGGKRYQLKKENQSLCAGIPKTGITKRCKVQEVTRLLLFFV